MTCMTSLDVSRRYYTSSKPGNQFGGLVRRPLRGSALETVKLFGLWRSLCAREHSQVHVCERATLFSKFER
jgi:hypothetical protein